MLASLTGLLCPCVCMLYAASSTAAMGKGPHAAGVWPRLTSFDCCLCLQIVERYTRASAELASAQAALSTFTELECELMGREGA